MEGLIKMPFKDLKKLFKRKKQRVTKPVVGFVWWLMLPLLLYAVSGRFLVMRLLGRRGADEPKPARDGEVRRITRPDGTEIHVELYGPADAPPIILTHGLTVDSTHWYYSKRYLSDCFRLIVWDVAGTGKSSRSPRGDYSMQKMAGDLAAVLDLAGSKPAILLGHSMGGMITLSLCKYFPQLLGSRVAGLVLANTTYTNPLRTTSNHWFWTAVQKPILEPMLRLNIIFSPLIWLQNWFNYLNGVAHIFVRLFNFSGQQTRGQLDFMARSQLTISPAVQARHSLALYHHDASDVLAKINVPTLIITADKDRLCLPSASHYMHAHIANSQLVTIQPSGHATTLEQPEQFNRTVRDFAERIFSSQQSGVA